MATQFTTSVIHPKPINPRNHIISQSQAFRVSSSERSNGVTDTQESSSAPGTQPPSARAQLDLLEQLTSGDSDSATADGGRTIRDQLAAIGGGREGEFSVALGKKNLKNLGPKFQTTSQKRNIKRQAYLSEVSQRNDAVFFSTVGAFVLVPPLVILAVAISTGYVQLFP